MHHSYKRRPDGKYTINGSVFERLVGSRAQVWHENAYKTSGGLTRFDLVMNKNGRIVSEKKHKSAKREKRLLKYGYTAKKGKFGAVKVGTKKSRKARK
jgi:preprotein translocase subunit SecA